MKAILLAAGFGTRLRPLTNTTPKCLVKIKNKPLLQIWLERLNDAGINNFLINTHYLSNNVKNFIKTSSFYSNCLIVYEKNLLVTEGNLLSNIKYSENQDLILVHADNYCLADFNEFIIKHKQRPKNCLMTMMTFRTDTPKSCGIVEIDEQKIVIGFHEKVDNPPSNLANGAVYILSTDFLKILKEKFPDASDFSTEVLHHFLNKIYTYETKNIFIDIGTIESYNKANLC